MPDVFDVLVVGGRIAGSLTALRLAARGASVRLLESGAFPSDTLSTHFFRGSRMGRALAEVGVLDEVLGTGAPPLACEYFSVDGAAFERSPAQEPGELGYDLSVRRIALDAILARRVEDSTVDMRTRTRAVDLVTRSGTVTGVVDHRGETHLATVVVGADGRRSTVARLTDAPDEKTFAPARAMYYRYAAGWRVQDPVGPEFLLAGDRFAYAFPSDAGLACLTVSVRLAEHESTGASPMEILEQTFAGNPQTAARMGALEWVGKPFVGLPSTSYWRRSAGAGWALVGDAGTHQDPWSGRGMDTAALQAEAFAEAFDGTPDGWNEPYEELRRSRTYDDFFSTSLLAPDLRRVIG
jgi:flavin-dependent dehydrogenase